jgi:urease accessory protein
LPSSTNELTGHAGPKSRSCPTFAGHLRLEAALDPEGRTQLVRQSFQAPFHVGKGYWDGRVLQVRIVNATAGVLSGDFLELDVDVASGASLVVTSPAATRAFMMEGGTARCRQHFSVNSRAWLEYASEPLFPHAETDYEQSTLLEADPEAAFYFAEALAPGRAARGEVWAWRRLRLALEVKIGGALILREQLDSSGPDFGRLAAFYGMPEAWFGTVVLGSPRLRGDDPLWEKIRELHSASCRMAPTCLCDGFWLVRVIASGSVGLRGALDDLRRLAATSLPRLQTDLRRV